MANDVGGLRAKLGLDTSEVDAGLDRVGGKFDAGVGAIKGYQKALLGLSFLLGSISDGDSKSFNALRSTLSKTVTTITGMSFALSSLGGNFAKFAGPVGIALGVIAGIASALQDMNREVTEEKRKRLKDYADTLERVAEAMGMMTEATRAAREEVIRFNISEAEKKLASLEAQQASLIEAQKKASGQKQTGSGAGDIAAGAVGSSALTTKINEQTEALRKLNEELDAFTLPVARAPRPLTPEEVEAARKERAQAFLAELHDRLQAQRDALREGSEIDQELIDRRREGEEQVDEAKKERLRILGEIQNDLIADELAFRIDAVEDEFQARVQSLRAVGATEAEIAQARAAADRKISDIRKDFTEDLRQRQADAHADELAQVENIVDTFQRGFARAGDTFISKLFEALQIAVQIAQALNAASARPGGGTFLDSLGVGAQLFTGVLGFASGGYTGSGSRNRPAGIVHKGEYVFEKPVVDRFGPMLSSLRDSLQQNALKGYASGGMVGGNVPILSSGNLRDEIRGLREDVRKTPVNVFIRGTLTGQKFLKEEQPKYEAFLKGKRV